MSDRSARALALLPLAAADRTRVMEGLGEDTKKSELAVLVKKLAPRWRGPMMQSEIRRVEEA